MNILAVKTDSENSELYLVKDNKVIDELTWLAGKSLAKDLNIKIKNFLEKNNLIITDIEGYAAFLGPGSFTGLRIGISTINAFAYVNEKPIVGAISSDWLNLAVERLIRGENDKVLLPFYGAEANITVPKK